MFSFLKKREVGCCGVEIIEVKENQSCCDEVEAGGCCSESQKEKESCC
ncbi:hypothetical protein [Bacillus sp. RO1]|nr:hypothetical protein [Bacillus sp. RO1]NLP51401.1 hypothetical protein [Bacillus sp. RO1]